METHDQNQLTSSGTIDPVCGMTVDPQKAAGSFVYRDQTYFFCSLGCREKFSADPELFLNATRASWIGIGHVKPVAITRGPDTSKSGQGWPRSDYTCPMHPEIVRDEPGSCPICGMALEPRTVSLADEKNPELIDMSRRFWVSLALSIPLLLIAMSEMLPGN